MSLSAEELADIRRHAQAAAAEAPPISEDVADTLRPLLATSDSGSTGRRTA